jgi:hypothetical protein
VTPWLPSFFHNAPTNERERGALLRLRGIGGVLVALTVLPLWTMAESSKPPEQPIKFSHKRHAALSLACKACHPSAAIAERAGLPAAGQCMLCHANIKKHSRLVQQLAAFQKEEKPIPWVRVYRLPDFVFFSHARHATKVGCAECHGPVERRDTLAAEIAHKMTTCMDCHRIRKASNQCHVCHELGR